MVIGIFKNLLKKALLGRSELFAIILISSTRVGILGLLYFILLGFLGYEGYL